MIMTNIPRESQHVPQKPYFFTAMLEVGQYYHVTHICKEIIINHYYHYYPYYYDNYQMEVA